MSFDTDWFSDCANTYHEEQKQLVYAARMGLLASTWGAHPPTFNISGRSVIDIGGGPVSLLLKCVERGRSVVSDPGEYPSWVRARYRECGIEYWNVAGEKLDIVSFQFDEALIYNVLQHVDDPGLVISNARKMAKTVRIFEWIDIPAYEGHPHMLTQAALDEWLGRPGFVANVNDSGAVGRAYYSVVR